MEEDPGPDPDPGIADIIEKITRTWCVEDSEFRKLENGFEWLPGSHAVRVRLSRHVQRPDRIRIWIMTDYLRSVPVESAEFVRLVGHMPKFVSPTYSLVYPPAEIWRAHFDNHPAELHLFSSAYVDENIVGWLPRFLAQMAIMQPISAEIQAAAMSDIIGGQPAYAGDGKRDSVSDVLSVAETLFVPEGEKESKWAGSEEFPRFVDDYARNDTCIGFVDDEGMTLATPFGADCIFIKFRTDQRNARLGSGLLITIQFGACLSVDHACIEAAGLNYLEAIIWTDFPQLGCWHPDPITENEANLAHSCFIPNAFFGPGLVTNLALWSIARVKWVRRRRFPDLEDKTMADIMLNRLAGPELNA